MKIENATQVMNVDEANEVCDTILDELTSVVVCERLFFELLLVCILTRSHVLLEDVPGTGKSLTGRCVAETLGLEFSRIQFTPDLLPSHVTGTHIYNESENSFEFREGPIFANVVLADEINRAPPKTQAALLEAMEERQVTVGNETRELPQPFFVIATQNPIEQSGTFGLPEAQVDRFAVKTNIGYPDRDGELTILNRRRARAGKRPSINRRLSPDQVAGLQRIVESIHIEDSVVEYVVDIARGTRDHPSVDVGVSPRAAQHLFEASRAHAVIAGREFVTPDDVKRMAGPVLAHRLVLLPDARMNSVEKRDVIDDVVDTTPIPTITSPTTSPTP